MNADPGTFINAASRERLEAAHDFRDGVAPFGLRYRRFLLRVEL
jgi:hypothetical protein